MGVVIGASPTATALAAAHHPCLRKQNSDSLTPTTAKKAKRPGDATSEDVMLWVSLNNVIQGLVKDPELLKSAKAAHSKEVKTLKVDLTKLGTNLATAQEGWRKAIETLKTTQEDAIRTFKESEDFHEESWLTPLCTLGPLWISEADYGMDDQDAQKEIFRLLKARDSTFSPAGWGLLDPATPVDTQGAEGVTLNASVDTLGDIPMDSAYLESAANVDSVAAMDRALVPTLTEVGQSDVAAIEEDEDPSDALQLNHQRAGSSERHLPTGTSEAGASGVPQSEA
nr:uncharacterized protein LOC109180246 [Ipomoea batatas]